MPTGVESSFTIWRPPTRRCCGIEPSTVAELGVAGRSDPDILLTAVADGYVLFSENVADFAHFVGEHLNTGAHHPGIRIADSVRWV